jgi:DNA polymerase
MNNILTIDFETYYAKDFGLTKLTTEEYLRHDRFEVIGVAVKVNNQEGAAWCSGTKPKVQEFLDSFDWENSTAVAHNAMFDMAILNWHFNIRPKNIVDTLSMARALHTVEVGGSLAALAEYYGLGQKGHEVQDAIGKYRIDFTNEEMKAYGGYCINDAELTYQLFNIFRAKLPVSELQLIDLTVRMFSEPAIKLDKEVLQEHLAGIVAAKEALLKKISHKKEQLMSNAKFARALQEYNISPPTKVSPTTGKETYAFAKTDEGFKALQAHDNPDVQALVAARLGVKSTIEETRTERFIGIADRGLLPIPLRYYAAHTGRWGGDDKVNMQNLPRGSMLKKALCAPEGYKFIDCDLSQIEARTLAWLAEAHELVEAFDKGDDVYKIMAAAIYDKPQDEITKEERFIGKTTILGAGYQMGSVRFQAQLKSFGVELKAEECKRIIDTYRTTYADIPKLWRGANESLGAMMQDQITSFGLPDILKVEGKNGIKLPNGLYVKYPNLRHETDESGQTQMVYDTRRGRTILPTKIYGGKVIENVCQALARIVIGEQLLRVAQRYKVVMTVHDAIGCIVPEADVEEGLQYVEKVMKIRPRWAPDLPLNCEGGYGNSYGDC